jgi:hypothetical protein
MGCSWLQVAMDETFFATFSNISMCFPFKDLMLFSSVSVKMISQFSDELADLSESGMMM